MSPCRSARDRDKMCISVQSLLAEIHNYYNCKDCTFFHTPGPLWSSASVQQPQALESHCIPFSQGESQFLRCDIWFHGMNVSTHISSGSISFLCFCSTNGLFPSIVPLMVNSAMCSVPDRCLSNGPLSSSRPTGATCKILLTIWPWAVVDFIVWYPSKTIHILASGTPQTRETLRWMCRIWQWSVVLKV